MKNFVQLKLELEGDGVRGTRIKLYDTFHM